MSTCTYFVAHDLDMGDPPTRTGHFIGERRQNKVSWFRERLPHQERPGLIALTDQLLSIWTRQVAMVPPEDTNTKGEKSHCDTIVVLDIRCSHNRNFYSKTEYFLRT